MKCSCLILILTLAFAEGGVIPSQPPDCKSKPVDALVVTGIMDTQEGRDAVEAVVSILPPQSTVAVGDIGGGTYSMLVHKVSIFNESDAEKVKAFLDKHHFHESRNILKTDNFEDLVQAKFRSSDAPQQSKIVFLVTGNKGFDRVVRINLPITYLVSVSDPGTYPDQMAPDPQHRLSMEQLSTKEFQSLLCADSNRRCDTDKYEFPNSGTCFPCKEECKPMPEESDVRCREICKYYRERNTPETSTPVTDTPPTTTTATPAQEHTDNKNLVIALVALFLVPFLVVVITLAVRERGRLDQWIQRCKRQSSSESLPQIPESVTLAEGRSTGDNDGNVSDEDEEGACSSDTPAINAAIQNVSEQNDAALTDPSTRLHSRLEEHA